MSVPEIVLGIILILAALAIIVVVLLQEGHDRDVGVVTGGADTFLSQNSPGSVDKDYCSCILCSSYCHEYFHVYDK